MTSDEYHPHDALERRRRQIEKAKAAHLSRQLQTRLQYARLKVDHGWQKQTLNEVENLYFHHYRARLPLRKIQKTERNTANTQNKPSPKLPTVSASVETSSSQTQPPQSQQQLEVVEPVTPDAESSAIVPTDEDGTYEMDVDYNPQESSDIAPPATLPITAAESPARPPASPAVTPATPPASLPLPSTPSAVPTSAPQWPSKPQPSLPQPESASKPTQTGPTKPSSTVASPPVRKLPIPRLPSVAYGSTTVPRTRPRPQPPRSTFSPSPSSSSTTVLTNSALTYDSFWSSHSAVSPSSVAYNYRSPQVSAPYPSLGRTGGGVSLATLPAGYALMGTTSSTFSISPGPAVARKHTAVPTATAATSTHGGTG